MRLLSIVAAVLFVHFAAAGALADASSVEFLGFRITFVGVEYDPKTDESKWTYRVEGVNAAHDLSHWGLELCLPSHVVTGSSHPGRTEIGADPHTKIAGIKFDVEVGKSDSRLFWFTLKGNWQVGPVEVGGKAATNVEAGKEILGPKCTAPSCLLDVTVRNTRLDLRLLRPGVYATVLSVVQISGQSAATVTFSEFGDVRYLANPSAAPIRASFSIGATLDEAERFGWLSPEVFNTTEINFSRPEVQAGVQLVIWLRVTISEFNSSSDYAAIGTVNVAPVCA